MMYIENSIYMFSPPIENSFSSPDWGGGWEGAYSFTLITGTTLFRGFGSNTVRPSAVCWAFTLP